MAGELAMSSLYLEVMDIQRYPGSPYHKIEITIHVGGKLIKPLQVLSFDYAQKHRTEFTDKMSVVLALGTGTLMNDIGPFQDDIKITVAKYPLDGDGSPVPDNPVKSRTYKAYIGDQIERPVESGMNPMLQSTEAANRMISYPVFVLEEVGVAELRKQSFGTIIQDTVPIEAVKTILKNFMDALKLAADEVLNILDVVPANNQTPKKHIVINAPTPVLDIPDLLQNKQGGIYSTGLGFYIQGQGVYLWPLYDTSRFESARRVIRILLAPNKQSQILDRTWKANDRTVTIYSAGISKIEDNSFGNLNIGGNAVRFTDVTKLMEDFGVVEGNKLKLARSLNNNEYVSAIVGNGQNYAKVSDIPMTSNVYFEASKQAMKQGAMAYIPWKRSDPAVLTPGMPAEILYDYNGEIKTISGVVVGATHRYELEGTGMNAFRYYCTTVLEVFLDRTDPDYDLYLKSGGTVSATPEITSI